MNRLSDWWNRSSAVLAELVERPWLCAGALLALRSFFRPYLGLVHDAKLYSLQVASHIWPNFDADLFFAFGSQDQFSIFSRLMAPLAGAIGIELSFFLVWMICTAAIIYAEVQLVRRLVTGQALAAVALVLLTLTDVAYGGRQVFHVHEPFLTARLPAVAFVLFAFVRLLDGRLVLAGILIALSMMIHPIVSVPALCVGAAFVASARWRTERLALVGAAGAAVAGAIAAIPAVGELLLGQMGGEWLRTTKVICHHCFLTNWSANDWCRTCLALGIVIGVRRDLSPRAGRLVYWVAFTAIAGLVVTGYAEWSEYALLIQGQAFRAMWLAELLAYPLGLVYLEKLWRGDAARKLLSVPITAYVIQPFVHGSTLGGIPLDTIGLWALLSLCAGAVIHAWSRRSNEDASLGLCVLVGMLGMTAVISLVRFTSFVAFPGHSSERITVLWWLGSQAVSVAVLLTAGLAGLVLMIRRFGVGWRMGALAWSTWLIVATLPLTLESMRLGKKGLDAADRDLEFVQTFLQSHPSVTPLEVYWPADPSPVWLKLHATSYYSWYQVWGIIFSEDLAEVAAARAQLARRFEVEWMRAAGLPESMWAVPLEMLQTDFREPPPQEQDLLRLAEDPALDWIVMKHRFGDLAAATNGSVYIYDARQLRGPRGAVVRAE